MMPSASSTRVGSLRARLISATSWSATRHRFAADDLVLVQNAVRLFGGASALVQPLAETTRLVGHPELGFAFGRADERCDDRFDPLLDLRLVNAVHADDVVQVVKLLLVERPRPTKSCGRRLLVVLDPEGTVEADVPCRKRLHRLLDTVRTCVCGRHREHRRFRWFSTARHSTE